MGVPLLTLEGSRHGARFGCSLLQNLGLGELVAADGAEYIEKACALAADRELVAELHRVLPTLFQQSPLMDFQGYVHDVEAAYEKIWRKWSKD